jgi:hypothetical protein
MDQFHQFGGLVGHQCLGSTSFLLNEVPRFSYRNDYSAHGAKYEQDYRFRFDDRDGNAGHFSMLESSTTKDFANYLSRCFAADRSRFDQDLRFANVALGSLSASDT